MELVLWQFTIASYINSNSTFRGLPYCVSLALPLAEFAPSSFLEVAALAALAAAARLSLTALAVAAPAAAALLALDHRLALAAPAAAALCPVYLPLALVAIVLGKEAPLKVFKPNTIT